METDSKDSRTGFRTWLADGQHAWGFALPASGDLMTRYRAIMDKASRLGLRTRESAADSYLAAGVLHRDECATTILMRIIRGQVRRRTAGRLPIAGCLPSRQASSDLREDIVSRVVLRVIRRPELVLRFACRLRAFLMRLVEWECARSRAPAHRGEPEQACDPPEPRTGTPASLDARDELERIGGVVGRVIASFRASLRAETRAAQVPGSAMTQGQTRPSAVPRGAALSPRIARAFVLAVHRQLPSIPVPETTWHLRRMVATLVRVYRWKVDHEARSGVSRTGANEP